MSTQAHLGYQTKLFRGDGEDPEGWDSIAEIKQYGDFGAERELVEATNHDSPNFFREFILGLKDGMEFAITANWNPGYDLHDPVQGLIADFDGGSPHNYQLRFPTTPLWLAEYAALTRIWKIVSPVDQIQDFGVTFKITADITWDSPSSP